MKLTKQEQRLLECYRHIESQWERMSLLLIVKSMSWGHLTKKTDSYSVQKVRRMLVE
jgi:hypothetical protein